MQAENEILVRLLQTKNLAQHHRASHYYNVIIIMTSRISHSQPIPLNSVCT